MSEELHCVASNKSRLHFYTN